MLTHVSNEITQYSSSGNTQIHRWWFDEMENGYHHNLLSRKTARLCCHTKTKYYVSCVTMGLGETMANYFNLSRGTSRLIKLNSLGNLY